MKQSSGAKPARSCSHSMHWTAANPRTEGVVPVSPSEDRGRPKTLKITEVQAHCASSGDGSRNSPWLKKFGFVLSNHGGVATRSIAVRPTGYSRAGEFCCFHRG